MQSLCRAQQLRSCPRQQARVGLLASSVKGGALQRCSGRRATRIAAQQQQQQGPGQQQGQQQPNPEERDKQLALLCLAASVAGGVVLHPFGQDSSLPEGLVRDVSSGLGWSYLLAWSISFYPQVIENAQRRSVSGLSADYLVYSMLGYTAYTAYTAALHFNPGVQAAYMAAHAGSLPDVQLTDFLFAGHALLVTIYTLYQCVLYGGNGSSSDGGGGSSSSSSNVLRTSRVANITTAAVFAAVVAYSGHIGSTCGPDDCDAWLPMLYLLGFIKVSMTLIKYTPQALLNAQRQSTEGWSINNVLLDLAGGLLSFGQVGLNALARGELSVITGNPAKLGISLLSIAFDLIFITQHYVLYPSSSSSSVASEEEVVVQGNEGVGSSSSSSGSRRTSTSSSSSSSRRPLGRRLVAVAVRAANGLRQQ